MKRSCTLNRYWLKPPDHLSDNLTTERSFSAQLFKGSKYLEHNQSVLAAVLQVLGIEKFPKSDPKEQQWRLVVDCAHPERIVLCENLAALKSPDDAIRLNTELWYVGGNNTRILENLSAEKLLLPIFYMCDWDYDGLRIYETVQRIMKDKNNVIGLLIPYDLNKKLPVDSPYHNSHWKSQLYFSGLTSEQYSQTAIDLINGLIENDQWVEEESQDFEAMLKHNNVIS